MLSLQVSDHTGQEWLTAFQVCTGAQILPYLHEKHKNTMKCTRLHGSTQVL